MNQSQVLDSDTSKISVSHDYMSLWETSIHKSEQLCSYKGSKACFCGGVLEGFMQGASLACHGFRYQQKGWQAAAIVTLGVNDRVSGSSPKGHCHLPRWPQLSVVVTLKHHRCGLALPALCVEEHRTQSSCQPPANLLPCKAGCFYPCLCGPALPSAKASPWWSCRAAPPWGTMGFHTLSLFPPGDLGPSEKLCLWWPPLLSVQNRSLLSVCRLNRRSQCFGSVIQMVEHRLVSVVCSWNEKITNTVMRFHETKHVQFVGLFFIFGDSEITFLALKCPLKMLVVSITNGSI